MLGLRLILLLVLFLTIEALTLCPPLYLTLTPTAPKDGEQQMPAQHAPAWRRARQSALAAAKVVSASTTSAPLMMSDGATLKADVERIEDCRCSDGTSVGVGVGVGVGGGCGMDVGNGAAMHRGTTRSMAMKSKKTA